MFDQYNDTIPRDLVILSLPAEVKEYVSKIYLINWYEVKHRANYLILASLKEIRSIIENYIPLTLEDVNLKISYFEEIYKIDHVLKRYEVYADEVYEEVIFYHA